jgi:purine-cytosine permease-like protein
MDASTTSARAAPAVSWFTTTDHKRIGLLYLVTTFAFFLYLIGSVFVPLYAVAAVDFFFVSRQRWDVSTTSPLRVAPVIAWACGFIAYQLVYPGTVPGWADFWTWLDGRIGFVPPGWLGSSVAAIAVSGSVMLVSGLLLRYRRVAAA